MIALVEVTPQDLEQMDKDLREILDAVAFQVLFVLLVLFAVYVARLKSGR